MSNPFKLLMVASYMETAGNTLQRHLDGHKNLISAPFETQIGTKYSSNILTPFYHFRYSWPVIPTNLTPREVFNLFFDEETKTYTRTPDRSKFKDCGMIMDETLRYGAFLDALQLKSGDFIFAENFVSFSRRDYIEAYYRAMADSWQNRNRSQLQTYYVGYYPLATVDADPFFNDFPDGHMIHIIRNVISGFADTKKRPFPLSLVNYANGWNITQLYAAKYKRKYPDHFHIIRYEDLVVDKRETLEPILNNIGLPWDEICAYPSWNGKKMDSIFPWGTIKQATTESNLATAAELSVEERVAICLECGPMLDQFYDHKEINSFAQL